MPEADLVLEGGGVKGLGTAGAVMALLDAGYTFPRVAGTSVGALTAAFAAAGADSAGLRDVLGGLDQLGVRTFADLRRDDPGDDPALSDLHHRYGLVVMATDVTHGRLLRPPWDYQRFDLEPDEQLVADAVRMSLSIPFYFEPCSLRHRSTGATATIVDGGVLSNFAIEIFDRTDGRPARWPTFGVRLLPDLPAGLGEIVPVLGLPMLPTVQLLQQVVATAI